MHTLTFTSNSEPSIATKDTRELKIIFDRTRGLFKDKMEEHKQSHCSSDDILWMHKFIRHWLYTCMANTRGNFQTFLFIELLQVKIASESIKVCFLYREKPAPMNARAYEGETSTRDRRNPCDQNLKREEPATGDRPSSAYGQNDLVIMWPNMVRCEPPTPLHV